MTYRGQTLEVDIGLETVTYTLREGKCLVIRHEKELRRKFGFTPESIVAAAKEQVTQGM